MIHLLVYHPNKGLGLCAYGYGGILHCYLQRIVVFLVETQISRVVLQQWVWPVVTCYQDTKGAGGG